MVKKKESTPEADPLANMMKSLDAQYKVARIDMMGKFQNQVIELISKHDLMAQEIVFVLEIVKDNIMGNFLQLVARKTALEAQREEDKPKEK